MANNTFCASLFYACYTALMRDRGRMLPISLQEVFALFADLGVVKLPVSVAFTHGDTVPIFNGSPPL